MLKRITSEEIRGAVVEFINRTRRGWREDVAGLAAGAVLLYATPAGWRLEWRRSHARRGAGSEPGPEIVARYKIPADVLEPGGAEWLALAVFLSAAVTGSARAINANAGRSLEARRRAAAIGVAARQKSNFSGAKNA